MVPSRGTYPFVEFLDYANATPSSLFEYTPTPVPCRLYVSSPSTTLPAIEESRLIAAALLSLAFLSKFLLHLHPIQLTRSLRRALHGECVDFYRQCPPRKRCVLHICSRTPLPAKWRRLLPRNERMHLLRMFTLRFESGCTCSFRIVAKFSGGKICLNLSS